MGALGVAACDAPRHPTSIGSKTRERRNPAGLSSTDAHRTAIDRDAPDLALQPLHC
jgi:hypothetical protein